MKDIYRIIRNHVITGFIFLMPVLITLSIVAKYWKSLVVLGGKLSRLFFLDTILGTAGDAIMAIILMLFCCVIAGFLVKLTLFKGLSDKIDTWLGTIIPSYNTLKSSTLKKIGSKVDEGEVVYPTCLVNMGGLWQPAYLIEKKDDGLIVAYVPNSPNVSTGQVFLANETQWRQLEMDSSMLNNALKKLGKGL